MFMLGKEKKGWDCSPLAGMPRVTNLMLASMLFIEIGNSISKKIRKLYTTN